MSFIASDPGVRQVAVEIQTLIKEEGWCEVIFFLTDGGVQSVTFGALLLWFALALLLNWSGFLDRQFTYQFPRRRVHWAIGVFLVTVSLWSVYSFYYAELPIVWEFSKTLGCLGLLPPLFAGIDQSDRARIEIRREARYSEGTFRVVFVALLVAQACLAHKMKFLRLSGGLP